MRLGDQTQSTDPLPQRAHTPTKARCTDAQGSWDGHLTGVVGKFSSTLSCSVLFPDEFGGPALLVATNSNLLSPPLQRAAGGSGGGGEAALHQVTAGRRIPIDHLACGEDARETA